MKQQWQYVVEGFTGLSGMQQKLASFAAQGWEFVDVLKTENSGMQLVLKKPATIEPDGTARPKQTHG